MKSVRWWARLPANRGGLKGECHFECHLASTSSTSMRWKWWERWSNIKPCFQSQPVQSLTRHQWLPQWTCPRNWILPWQWGSPPRWSSTPQRQVPRCSVVFFGLMVTGRPSLGAVAARVFGSFQGRWSSWAQSKLLGWIFWIPAKIDPTRDQLRALLYHNQPHIFSAAKAFWLVLSLCFLTTSVMETLSLSSLLLILRWRFNLYRGIVNPSDSRKLKILWSKIESVWMCMAYV